MTENNPLVTLCLLTHNWAKHLEKSLELLINQSYKNCQIIISDDKSSDNTWEVIERLQKKYPQIIIRKNVPTINTEEFFDVSVKHIPAEKNTKTYDILFNHCNSLLKSDLIKGEFIVFCHQDDLYQTDIVKKEVEFLLEHPEAAGVFTQGNIIDQHDLIIGQYPFPRDLKGKNIYTFSEIFGAILIHGNFLLTPSFMIRKDIFDKVGLFDDQGPFGGSDDLEMWLRILEKYPVGILQEKLIHWRTDGRGKKYNKLRTDKADYFKLMDYYLQDRQYIKTVTQKELRQYLYQKDFDNTLRAMNFLIKGQESEAKNIINHSFSFENFLAFFENMKLLRAKVLALKVILFIGINLGLGKQLGKMLYKFA